MDVLKRCNINDNSFTLSYEGMTMVEMCFHYKRIDFIEICIKYGRYEHYNSDNMDMLRKIIDKKLLFLVIYFGFKSELKKLNL